MYPTASTSYRGICRIVDLVNVLRRQSRSEGRLVSRGVDLETATKLASARAKSSSQTGPFGVTRRTKRSLLMASE